MNRPPFPPAKPAPIRSAFQDDALIIVPVRNIVLFPGVVAPITVARPKSIAAAQQALREQRSIGILLQRDAEIDEPGPSDLHRICTIANIVRYSPRRMGHITSSARAFSAPASSTSFPARHFSPRAFKIFRSRRPPLPRSKRASSTCSGRRSRRSNCCRRRRRNYCRPSRQRHRPPRSPTSRPPTWTSSRRRSRRSWRRSTFRCAWTRFRAISPKRLEVLRLSNEIDRRPRRPSTNASAKPILREQMATIQRQLGEGDGKAQEVTELNASIAKAQMSPEAESQARKELRRYERMPEVRRPSPAWSAAISTGWSTCRGACPPEKPIDITEARRILDQDHYGLEKIKSRIIEYPGGSQAGAARQGAESSVSSDRPASARPRSGNRLRAHWIRPFVRVSLGGVHDEAEIRGTGALISARCPAISSRASRRPARAIAS